MNGMCKHYLRINLTDKTHQAGLLPEDYARDYIGGRGLALRLFAGEVGVAVAPLSSANKIVVAAGPEAGTGIPAGGGCALVTKSPLTGGVFSGVLAGEFGEALKRCGIDAFIIEGEASEPVFIEIRGINEIKFHTAAGIWKKDTMEAAQLMKQKPGADSTLIAIGTAGENQVLFSNIVDDKGRAFGRGGPGAVFGSKKLKGIVIVKGKSKVNPHSNGLLEQFIHSALDKIKVSPLTQSALPVLGTAGLVNVINELGMFPARNFLSGFSAEAIEISGEAMVEKYPMQQSGCADCPVNCSFQYKEGNDIMPAPGYDDIWSLGPNCGVFDLETILLAHRLCLRLGLDTISAGSTIAYAMEIAEKGILDDKRIVFGNKEVVIQLLQQVAGMDGFGQVMAQGVKKMSGFMGSESPAMHVKGLEIGGYDPRGAFGHALGLATSNNGGCHQSSFMIAMEVLAVPKKTDRFAITGKADLVVLIQNQTTAIDSLVNCGNACLAIGLDYHARFLSLVYGLEYGVNDLLKTGERIFNLERLYNYYSGITRQEDVLPARFLETPLMEGYSAGRVVPLNQMLDTYYLIRQWEADGKPANKLLNELGINNIVN